MRRALGFAESFEPAGGSADGEAVRALLASLEEEVRIPPPSPPSLEQGGRAGVSASPLTLTHTLPSSQAAALWPAGWPAAALHEGLERYVMGLLLPKVRPGRVPRGR